jgi:hypothetical protein
MTYHSSVTAPPVFPGGSINDFNEWRLARGFYRKSGLCQYCGAQFASDETVVIVRDFWAVPLQGKNFPDNDWIPVCVGCAGMWDPRDLAAAQHQTTCKGCGQSMLVPDRRVRTDIWKGRLLAIRASTCSSRCEQRYRRRFRQIHKEKINCSVCNVPFRPKRADARFCSNACRQWAYRRRQGMPR